MIKTVSRGRQWWVGILALALLGPGTVSRAANPPPQKTLKNLNSALEGEANAANRYRLFAQRAEEDNYSEVAKLFRAAAQSESVHRENHRMAILALGGKPDEIKLDPVVVKDTRRNLELPIQGEAKEQSEMYPKYIQQAEKDHAPEAVQTFTYARNAEAEHQKLFQNALSHLGSNPKVDFYVSKISGDTIAVPEGRKFAQAGTGEYLRVS